MVMPSRGTVHVRKATTSAATAPPTRGGGPDGGGLPGGGSATSGIECVVWDAGGAMCALAGDPCAGGWAGLGSRSQKSRGPLLFTGIRFPPLCHVLSRYPFSTVGRECHGKVSCPGRADRPGQYGTRPVMSWSQEPAWVKTTNVSTSMTKTMTPAAPRQYQE